MFNDVPSRSQILSYTFVDSCVTIAGVTIIAYDYLCTLKEETCFRLYGVTLSSISVGFLSAQIILTLRTCGMWGS